LKVKQIDIQTVSDLDLALMLREQLQQQQIAEVNLQHIEAELNRRQQQNAEAAKQIAETEAAQGE
jgi:hypothetical protein